MGNITSIIRRIVFRRCPFFDKLPYLITFYNLPGGKKDNKSHTGANQGKYQAEKKYFLLNIDLYPFKLYH